MKIFWAVSGSRNHHECMVLPLFISIIITLIKCCNEFPTEDVRVSGLQRSVPRPNTSRTNG